MATSKLVQLLHEEDCVASGLALHRAGDSDHVCTWLAERLAGRGVVAAHGALIVANEVPIGRVDRVTENGAGLTVEWHRTTDGSVDDWADTMLDALRDSDGGNNPFYSDDEDTISLARQLAEAIVAKLQAGE